MRKIIKISWFLISSFIIFMLLSFTTVVIVEHITTDVLINNFMSQGVYQEELSNNKIKYYKIPYDGNPTMTYDAFSHNCEPGGKGDILVSPEQKTIAPFLNEIITFYAGGHAGYCCSSYGDHDLYVNEDYTLETTFTQSIHTAKSYSKTDWIDAKYFDRVIGLRVDMTDEEYETVNSVINSYFDDYYNVSFFFNTTYTKYCSDLISSGFASIGKNLNMDGVTTSIYDLIVSTDTYISYYHYFKDGIKYVYFLG